MEQGEVCVRWAWIEHHADIEAEKDLIPFPEKVSQLIGIAISVILIAFFAIHQTRPTGFFTDEFGALGAALLYGMIVVNTVPMLVRLVTGRRNTTRPFEAAGNAMGFVALLYFLTVFPLDFSFFADPLPRALEFLLDWVTSTLAKWVLGIGVALSLALSIYTPILYLAVKKRLAGQADAP